MSIYSTKEAAASAAATWFDSDGQGRRLCRSCGRWFVDAGSAPGNCPSCGFAGEEAVGASSSTGSAQRRPDAVRWLPWMVAAWVAFSIPIPRWMAGYGVDIVMFVAIVWSSVLVARSRQAWGRVLGWTSIAVMAAFVAVTFLVGFIEGLRGF